MANPEFAGFGRGSYDRGMLRSRVSLALAAVLLAAAPAAAQPAEGGAPRQEGEYAGVTPGTPPVAEQGAKPRRPPAKKSLNWVGFTTRADGSSELFFQAVDGFTLSQHLEGTKLVVLLEGLSKQARNTRRPLDTRFFETSVARVTTKVVRARRARKGVPGHPAGVLVTIAFKDPKDAREGATRSDKGPDGMFYAYLGFGPPSTPGQIPENAERPSTISDPE